MKHFIITVDTEGDDQWKWTPGTVITTNNVRYLKRFQKLCDKYQFKPVWLSNWEMIDNPEYVHFVRETLMDKKCELGMHLHAWSTPPYYELKYSKYKGAPYLIEYPDDIMEEKIKKITDKFYQTFDMQPISHRAGRWAMNDTYFKMLHKYGYEIDCSYTPGIDWRSSVGMTDNFKGPDYRNVSNILEEHFGIIEVPVSTCKLHVTKFRGGLKAHLKNVYYAVKGYNMLFRPDGKNINALMRFIQMNTKSELDYLMFMIHSSELMPGGSPNFKTEESIEKLYTDLEILFETLAVSYKGYTLKEYCKEKVI